MVSIVRSKISNRTTISKRNMQVQAPEVRDCINV